MDTISLTGEQLVSQEIPEEIPEEIPQEIPEPEEHEVTPYVERNSGGKFVAGNKARTKALDRARVLSKKHKEYALGLSTSPAGRKALRDLLRNTPKDFFKHVESIIPKEVNETRDTEIRVVFPDYMLNSADKLALKESKSDIIELKETNAGYFSQVQPIRKTDNSESEHKEI